MRRCTLLALVLATLPLLPSVAAAGTPAQNLAWLNAKRAANGIPAGIVANPDWSSRCRSHVEYLRRHGTISHQQDPTKAGYSEAGNWAGTHAVLSLGANWTSTNFIWERAPFHLAQLLSPQLAEVGIADQDRYVCLTTWPGYTRKTPTENTVVTYPGNATAIYASEVTEEWPRTPAEVLGLRNPTGPHLFAYQWGPVSREAAGATIVNATLVGPGGPVAIRWVDRSTENVGGYLPTASGIVIPVKPLREGANYTATVAFSNDVRHTWSFTTSAAFTHALRNVRVRTTRVDTNRYRVRITGRVIATETGAGTAGVTLGFRLQGGERPVQTTGANGRFAVDYVVPASRRDRASLLVTVHGDQIAAGTYRARLPRGTSRSATPLRADRPIAVSLPATLTS